MHSGFAHIFFFLNFILDITLFMDAGGGDQQEEKNACHIGLWMRIWIGYVVYYVSVSVAKYDKCQTSSELMDCVNGERVELREWYRVCRCRCGCLCRIISGFINFRRFLIGVHATILKTQQHIGCNTTFNIQIIPNGSSFHINNQNLGFREMIRRSAAYLHHLMYKWTLKRCNLFC